MENKIFVKAAYFVKAAFFILMLFTTAIFTNAQSITFAQFFEQNGTNDFIFTNNFGSSGSFNTISGGSQIVFQYQNISGLPADLNGPQNATLTLNGSTTTPAFLSNDRAVQPFDQTVTIQITRNSPASSGNGTRTNLLTAVILIAGPTYSDLTGDNGGNSAAYTASTPNQIINYTSDFIDFSAPTVTRNLALSFSSVSPVYSIGAGGFLNSFAAAGTGTFAANPGPLSTPPTTSASVDVSGRVMVSKGRGLANARVTMTDITGETVTVLTNSSGYYRFAGVPVGQSVVLGVSAKRYTYTPKAVNVGEDLLGIDFYPQ